MDTRTEVGVGLGVVAVLTLILLTTRSPNVAIAAAVVGILAATAWLALALTRLHRARAWRQALRTARWRPASRDVNGRTEIAIERVAEHADRRELLGEQHVEWLDHIGESEGVWDAAFAEAWGRAKNRALVRNTEVER